MDSFRETEKIEEAPVACSLDFCFSAIILSIFEKINLFRWSQHDVLLLLLL